MKRSARIEKPVQVTLSSGKTLTVPPGHCWVEEDGDSAFLSWEPDEDRTPAVVSHTEFALRLGRRQIVFVSW
ncbi:MAG: hypothetical protein ACXWCU_16480 [Caldimonas sp.]